ncbi:MAG TPA: hypothetical protein VG096_16240 [Bryobacteraceae bacterium]|jgi:hypothetical protein|nr:hypothetical protein [Bryobacteraceae bacterium]
MALAMIFLFVLAVGASLFWLVRRIAFSSTHLPVTAGWIDELSSERYRPMLRLLDGGDLDFLNSQPGFTQNAAARVRKQRCQIFRGYLRCLSNDFDRVCLAIKLLMLQARDDRPDLATLLLRHRVEFATRMATIYFRLFLYRWGFCGVDVTGLVKTFDAVRVQLQTLAPVTMGMEA